MVEEITMHLSESLISEDKWNRSHDQAPLTTNFCATIYHECVRLSPTAGPINSGYYNLDFMTTDFVQFLFHLIRSFSTLLQSIKLKFAPATEHSSSISPKIHKFNKPRSGLGILYNFELIPPFSKTTLLIHLPTFSSSTSTISPSLSHN